MKIVSILCFFLGLFSTANSQILKEHKLVLSNGEVINYTSQHDIPSGLFKLISATDKEDLVRGNYVDGIRKGNWYFFNYDKSLFLRYNYDVNKLIQVDQKTLSYFDVNIEGGEDIKKNAMVPIPLWSFDSFSTLSVDNAAKVIDDSHRRILKDKNVKIKVLIDKYGHARYSVLYKVGKVDYEKEFTLENKSLNIEWLPATLNDATYPSEVTFLTRIINTSNTDKKSGHKRFKWD